MGLPEAPQGPPGVLAAVEPADFGELGIKPSQAKKLAKNGFGVLPLSAAVGLAHTLGGSLNWLAEMDDEPGYGADPGLRIDADRVRAAREALGAKEATLLDLTGRTRTEWRALMRGDEDPELREVIAIAKAVECEVEDLCS